MKSILVKINCNNVFFSKALKLSAMCVNSLLGWSRSSTDHILKHILLISLSGRCCIFLNPVFCSMPIGHNPGRGVRVWWGCVNVHAHLALCRKPGLSLWYFWQVALRDKYSWRSPNTRIWWDHVLCYFGEVLTQKPVYIRELCRHLSCSHRLW